VVQLEIVALNELYELTNLVRLDLPTHGLQVEVLARGGVHEVVMTSGDPAKLKAESLSERAKIAKGHIGDRPTIDAPQKLALVHIVSSDEETSAGRAYSGRPWNLA
jgi:hypothetical protein